MKHTFFVYSTFVFTVSLSISSQQDFCQNASLRTNPEAEELGYDYHVLFKTALYQNKENIFNIKQGGFQLNSGSKLACIPVTYKLFCTKDSQTCDILDGNSWSFLWTSFDTTDELGDFFLHYAIGGLRVIGFEWENECNAYQTPVNITLFVPKIRNGSTEEVTYITICKALGIITKMVRHW